MKPSVVIVGRPNVGKSTLLNRIVQKRVSIVEEQPGVTRDRVEVDANWLGRDFLLVDTGGWLVKGSELDAKVSRQSEEAIKGASLVLFLVDATVGVTDEDISVGRWLRSAGVPVLLVANKVDDSAHESQIWDLLSLGVGDPFPISALHGRGTGDLLDEVLELLPPEEDVEVADEEEEEGPRVMGVAIVGRPNVGKSTLFNRLIGEERAVVHDMPGTTRDSVDTIVETEAGPIRFIDTAGMRRKARIDEDTEYFSMLRALRSIDKADVALLLIDSTEGVTHQDQRLAERVDASGCPILILLNKWELLDAEQRRDVEYQLERKLHFLGDATVLKVSALTGKGVQRLMPALSEAIEAYGTRIPTQRVNAVIRAAQQAHQAPRGGRVLYATQGATDPPTFTLFTNKELPASYLRYLENQLRDSFDLGSTPIKLRVRRRG